MTESIEHCIKGALENRGFILKYNPEDNKYLPWYRVPFKVNFTNGNRTGDINLIRRKINLHTKGEYYKTIDNLTGELIHETGHVDIIPVELPLVVYSITQVVNQFDEPLKGALVTAGIMTGYICIARELIVEGYNCVKHGAKKYLKLRWGR